MSGDSRISAVITQCVEVMREAGLTAEEAINVSAELFPTILLNALPTEQMCHEILNNSVEAGHIFINENWREAAIAQRLARSRK